MQVTEIKEVYYDAKDRKGRPISYTVFFVFGRDDDGVLWLATGGDKLETIDRLEMPENRGRVIE